MTEQQSHVMTGAAATLAQLAAEGVELVLGIPGAHNAGLCDAVLDRPDLKFIGCRHEQAMTFMANGYTRSSGKIAVPLVVTGPGVTNSLTALADARCDSVPMVLVASCCSKSTLGKGAFHELKDQTAMLASVSKWNARVDDAADVPQAIHTAMVEAQSGRPGPTAVEVSLDAQAQSTNVRLIGRSAVPRPAAEVNVVDEAAELLSKARSPVVLIGAGAAQADCVQELTALVEQMSAPCFTTALGKGVVPDEHPLSLGWHMVGNGRPGLPMLKEADLVLVVGSSLDEVETVYWKLPLPANLVHIDIASEVIGRNYPAALGLVGDAKVVLGQLLEALSGRNAVDRPWPAERIARARTEAIDLVRDRPGYQFVQAMRQALDADATITNDASNANGWVLAYLPRSQPRTSYITRSLAALGYAFPAAVGAKLAYPLRQAVAVAGDGGFLFSSDALATAVQYKLNAVAVVFNDNCYSSIRDIQMRRFGRSIGVDLVNPDFVTLAEAYGAAGRRARKPDELRSELLAAFERDVPTLIDVPIEPDPAML
jgi:thiamine pyrophosphate-dependent acetolactate synthase large subunit-like protein